MAIKTHYPTDLDQVAQLICGENPLLICSAQTGTVIPYDQIEQWVEGDLSLVNLMLLPKKIEMIDQENVFVSGPVSWEELRSFLRSKGRDVLVSPTEQTASVLAGISTSCTGERSFAFGAFRDHILQVDYLDHQGQARALFAEHSIEEHPFFTSLDKSLWENYQKDFKKFRHFKNAPFPRLERETDLMVGQEGQLGVVVSAKIKTAPMQQSQFLAIALPRWQDDLNVHRQIYQQAQKFRNQIFSLELLDSNALSGFKSDIELASGGDIIIMEVLASELENIYEQLLVGIDGLELNRVVELKEGQHYELRSAVPRWVQERNSHQQTVKLGTDAQFPESSFDASFALYRKMAELSPCDYTLFGHFGDSHLHFNFLARPDQLEQCRELLEEFYLGVRAEQGSPFTEHGIGLLKQSYLDLFWGPHQFELLKKLKDLADPQHVFFPRGHFLRGRA